MKQKNTNSLDELRRRITILERNLESTETWLRDTEDQRDALAAALARAMRLAATNPGAREPCSCITCMHLRELVKFDDTIRLTVERARAA